MRKILLGVMAFSLFLTSCQKSEVTEDIQNGENQMSFSVYQGKPSKASELKNVDINKNGEDFPLYAYDGAQNAVKTFYFEEELTNVGGAAGSAGKWNTSVPRFLTALTPLQFYAYYPEEGVTGYSPLGELAADTYPSFAYAIQAEGKTTDLVAAKVNDSKNPSVLLKFQHILSQINFGVKGYYGARIAITDIAIKNVFKNGTFTYTALNGTWTGQTTKEASYTYDFNAFTTPGGVDKGGGVWEDLPSGETDNTYVFGDGGNWAAGKGGNVWYITAANAATQGSAIGATTPLANALMLMPQPLAAGMTDAVVTFKYIITDLKGAYIAGAAGVPLDGEFDLNMGVAAGTEYANMWLPGLRYLYIIDFTDFLAGKELSFKVDVETNEWENFNDPGDGTIDIGSIGFANLVPAAGTTVNLTGSLINNVTTDLINSLNAFTAGQNYTLNFKKVQFNGHNASVVFDETKVSATYEGTAYKSGDPITTAAGNGLLVFTRLP